MHIDAKVKLSPNFTLAELTTTGGRAAYNGEVLAWGHANLDKLELIAKNLLQPVRNYVGEAVVVTSCARTIGLNSAISGSSATSQHMLCEAADFIVPGLNTETDALSIVMWIARHSGIVFGQLIHETRIRADGTLTVWTHISLGAPYRPEDRCAEVLRYHDGKYEALKL